MTIDITETNGKTLMNPIEGKCNHFLLKRNRFCLLQCRQGHRYCGEHALEDKVPCPYTNSHSISKEKLRRHLFRCPFKPALEKPVYHDEDVNIAVGTQRNTEDSNGAAEDRKTLVNSSIEEIREIIDFVKKITANLSGGDGAGDYSMRIGVEDLPDGIAKSRSAIAMADGKHGRQTHSLVSIMHHYGMMSSRSMKTWFVEFGCGKGDLSAHIARSIITPDDEGSAACRRFLLVDRDNMACKKDNVIRHRFGFGVDRLRIDIKDLNLSSYFANHYAGEGAENAGSNDACMYCVSKHLCGAATDLSLTCLFNETSDSDAHRQMPAVSGIMIALCCHHRCSFDTYCNQAYLKRLGIDRRIFSLVSSMCSWATSGHGRQHPLAANKDTDACADEWYCEFGFACAEEKRQIGLLCKRILDAGRVEFIEQRSSLKARLSYYVPEQTSLENVVLIAH